MGVLGEMFGRKRIHEDSDAAQGGQRWELGPIDLDKGVVTVQAAGAGPEQTPTPGADETDPADGVDGVDGVDGANPAGDTGPDRHGAV